MQTNYSFEKTISIIRKESKNKILKKAAKNFTNALSLPNYSLRADLNFNPELVKSVCPEYLSYKESFSLLLLYQFIIPKHNKEYANRYFKKYLAYCLDDDENLGPELPLIYCLRPIVLDFQLKYEKDYEEILRLAEDKIFEMCDVLDERISIVIAFLHFIRAELFLRKRNYIKAIQSFKKAKALLNCDHKIDEIIGLIFKRMDLNRVGDFYISKTPLEPNVLPITKNAA